MLAMIAAIVSAISLSSCQAESSVTPVPFDELAGAKREVFQETIVTKAKVYRSRAVYIVGDVSCSGRCGNELVMIIPRNRELDACIMMLIETLDRDDGARRGVVATIRVKPAFPRRPLRAGEPPLATRPSYVILEKVLKVGPE